MGVFTYSTSSFLRLLNTLSGRNDIAFEDKYLLKEKCDTLKSQLTVSYFGYSYVSLFEVLVIT